MSTDIQKIRKTVKEQLEQTDKVIASNEAIAELVSRTNSTLEAGFSGLAYGMQELCYSIDDGFREASYKLDLQNETLKRIEALLEGPLDTQAKELRKRGKVAYDNDWFDEAETDLLEAERKNYQDFIALHILGNIYCFHKKNNQKALEYYEKAAKYAAPRSKADACKALLCAANVYKELGNSEDAYKSTKLAIETLSGVRFEKRNVAENLCTQVFYNHAAYAAMTSRVDESIKYLRNVEVIWNKDATCLIAADNDERFSNVKQEKENLKRELRDGQRRVVEPLRERLVSLKNDFDAARKVAEDVGITNFTSMMDDLAALERGLVEVDILRATNAYHDLLRAEQIANDVYRKSVEDFNKNIEEWVKIKEVESRKLGSEEARIQPNWKHFLLWIVWISLFIIISVTATSKVAAYNTIFGLMFGPLTLLFSLMFMIDAPDAPVTSSIPLMLFGFFMGWVLPVIVWFIYKNNKTTDIRNKIQKENNVVARLQDLKKK